MQGMCRKVSFIVIIFGENSLNGSFVSSVDGEIFHVIFNIPQLCFEIAQNNDLYFIAHCEHTELVL